MAERLARPALDEGGLPIDRHLRRALVASLPGFWGYLAEREQVLIRRLAGEPPPWTEDWALRSFRFLNVYREDDRVNQAITGWLLPQLRGELVSTTLVNLIAARHFNREETIRAVLPVTREHPGFRVPLAQLGWHPYTTAYRTTVFVNLGSLDQRANSETALRGWWAALPALHDLRYRSMEEVWGWLKALPGIGPFVAYMIACDLTYVEGLVSYDMSGRGWCYPHVGSRRALARMMGLQEDQVHVREATALCRALWPATNAGLAQRGFPFRRGPLTLRHVEDGLCEYHRYLKARTESTSRLRLYRPHTAHAILGASG